MDQDKNVLLTKVTNLNEQDYKNRPGLFTVSAMDMKSPDIDKIQVIKSFMSTSNKTNIKGNPGELIFFKLIFSQLCSFGKICLF